MIVRVMGEVAHLATKPFCARPGSSATRWLEVVAKRVKRDVPLTLLPPAAPSPNRATTATTTSTAPEAPPQGPWAVRAVAPVPAVVDR